jgi:phage-related tail protein
MSTRSSQVEELKSTITAQDQTISTLSAQFASLQTSHEAHIASLSEAHAKEISTLKTYARVLEEQSQQKSLHHGTSHVLTGEQWDEFTTRLALISLGRSIQQPPPSNAA